MRLIDLSYGQPSPSFQSNTFRLSRAAGARYWGCFTNPWSKSPMSMVVQDEQE